MLIVLIKLSYIRHIVCSPSTLEKALTEGKIEGNRRRGQPAAHNDVSICVKAELCREEELGVAIKEKHLIQQTVVKISRPSLTRSGSKSSAAFLNSCFIKRQGKRPRNSEKLTILLQAPKFKRGIRPQWKAFRGSLKFQNIPGTQESFQKDLKEKPVEEILRSSENQQIPPLTGDFTVCFPCHAHQATHPQNWQKEEGGREEEGEKEGRKEGERKN
ncbi:hypothetical protein L345_03793, partial [Ophiophagus hannah]